MKADSLRATILINSDISADISYNHSGMFLCVYHSTGLFSPHKIPLPSSKRFLQ